MSVEHDVQFIVIEVSLDAKGENLAIKTYKVLIMATQHSPRDLHVCVLLISLVGSPPLAPYQIITGLLHKKGLVCHAPFTPLYNILLVHGVVLMIANTGYEISGRA